MALNTRENRHFFDSLLDKVQIEGSIRNTLFAHVKLRDDSYRITISFYFILEQHHPQRTRRYDDIITIVEQLE